MDNLARKHEQVKPQLEYGQVVSVAESIVVGATFGDIEARCAVSCLVKPEEGDTVLLSVDAEGGAWILSVLTRAGLTPTALEVEGDTLLRVKGGGLTVVADTELSCLTGKAALQSEDIEIAAGTVSLTSRLFTSNVERVKRVAGTVDDISREFTRRVVNYFRFTKEQEDCQAGSRRQLVDETMTVHSKNTVIVSEEHVKIDGELIHMG
ncbi:DUF3540 domain-containing protein [Maridesulfovibrio hydrothermalis]|uniref:DUF3540 domain-containing protein n=1 Tax=Maridesulfovibrio hydrothermalis AM13 = DSM 14728 TaxID=1121451 RepID=L0RD61_9BACT|nr:DUF3540 domain-containing protein [Maridesulfovibrio hydrothermalis]CCO24162.1 conserved protein of unknown function [Maridesulfovibrio hydrothermalis AM13 = DSM 14728]